MDITLKFSGTTTNATETEIFRSDGSRLLIATGAAYRVQGTALAVDGSISVREWELSLLIKNVGGTVSFVGLPNITDLRGDTGTSGWNVDFAADNTNHALNVNVTGEASHTISWSIEVTVNVIGDTNPAIAGYYCDEHDLAYMLSETTLIQLSNDTAGALVTDNNVIIAIIGRAQAYIDSELGGTYTVPFSPVPALIKNICVTLSCYDLMLRRFSVMDMPKQWIDAREFAVRQIAELSSLEQRLDPVLYPIGSVAGVMQQAAVGERLFDFNSTTNQISEF